MEGHQAKRSKVFICYSHKDNEGDEKGNKKWLDRLQTFLAPLQEYCNIDIWSDTRIDAGLKWVEEIKKTIESAKVAVVLLSENFLASDFIKKEEIPRLLIASEKNTLTIIPVCLTKCLYEVTPLAKFQAINPEEHLTEENWREIFSLLGNRIKNLLSPKSDLIHPVKDVSTPAVPPENMPPLPPKELAKRVNDIESLKQHISNGGIVIVHGLFGIGKSWLTLKVAHQMYDADELPGGVAWINYESYHSYEESLPYEECLRQTAHIFLGDRLEKLNDRQCEEQIKRHLQNKRGLLIFDNVNRDGLKQDLVGWLKRIPKSSCVLLTTPVVPECLKDQPSLRIICINGLEGEDAKHFFIEKAKFYGMDLGRERDQRQVSNICNLVYGHPLMLETLAKRSKELPLTELVNIADHYRTQPPQEIWQKSLNPLYESLSQDAQTILTKASVLPSGIGVEVIKVLRGIEDCYPVASKLVGTSMWYLGSNGRYVINPLVRNFALQRLGDQRRDIERQVASIITHLAQNKAKLIQPDEVDGSTDKSYSLEEMKKSLDWFEEEWLNLKACAKYARQHDEEQLFCDLVDTILQFMIRRGHWDDCKKLYKKALEIRRQDNDKPGEARTLNDLGVCYQFENRLEEAIDCCEKSLELQRQLQGNSSEITNNEQLAKTLNTLGYLHFKKAEEKNDLNDFKHVERYYQDALEICKKGEELAAGKTNIDKIKIELSQTYSNLGLLYMTMGKQMLEPETSSMEFKKAEQAFKQSIKIRVPGDPREGQTRNRLGDLYLLKGNLWAAKKEYRKSLDTLKEVEDKFELGISHKGLGMVAQEAGKLDDAVEAYRESIRNFKNCPVEEGEVHINLIDVYKSKGNKEDAMKEGDLASDLLDLTERNDLKDKLMKKMVAISKM